MFDKAQDHPLPRLRICSRRIPPRCSTPARLPRDVRWSDGTMNRLYVVESGYSITGAAADHRLPLRPSQMPALVGRLQQAVERLADPSAPAMRSSTTDSYVDKFIGVLARDLHRASRPECDRGRPATAGGSPRRRTSFECAAGQRRARPCATRQLPTDRRPHVEAIAALAAAMQAGQCRHVADPGWQPGVRRARGCRFRRRSDQGPHFDSRGSVSQRDRAALPVACAAGAFPRILGGRPVV